MSDRQSSFIAAIAMAAMFSVGIAFGIALDHRVLHRRPPRPTFGADRDRDRVGLGRMPAMPPGRVPPPNAEVGMPRSERALDGFARELGLTDAQRSVADSILRHEFEAVESIRGETWPRMQAVMAETRRKLDSVLSPAQRERYREMLLEQERRFRARMPDRRPFPPHNP